MSSLTPDEGLEWFGDRAIERNNAGNERVYSIAVGDGGGAATASDTQLDNEIFRTNDGDSNGSIQGTSADDGVIEARITVSGGTEVPANTDITELGVWARDPSITKANVTDADDYLVYAEQRSAVTIESGDTKTFSMKIDLNRA